MPKICLQGQNNIIYFCAWLKVFCYFHEGQEQEQHSAECQNSLTIFLAALQIKSLSAFSVDKIKDIMEKVNILYCDYHGLSEFDLWNFLYTTKSNVMNNNPVSRLKKEQKYCKLDLSILNTEVI